MPDRWKHKERGTTYERIGGALVQNSGGGRICEGDVLTVYRGEDGQLWARPSHEFHDGRFERVTE